MLLLLAVRVLMVPSRAFGVSLVVSLGLLLPAELCLVPCWLLREHTCAAAAVPVRGCKNAAFCPAIAVVLLRLRAAAALALLQQVASVLQTASARTAVFGVRGLTKGSERAPRGVIDGRTAILKSIHHRVESMLWVRLG